MIDVKTRLHDKFSVEFKTGYTVDRKGHDNKFIMNTWVFIPYSLDINAFTYSKNHFYRDVKSYLRLITPVYRLEQIADNSELPYMFLYGAFQELAIEPTDENMTEFEYQIKMFISIVKSALRQATDSMLRKKDPESRAVAISQFKERIENITSLYRELLPVIQKENIPEQAVTYFSFGDEFLSNRIEHKSYEVLERLKKKFPLDYEAQKGPLLQLIRKERSYKISKGYQVLKKNSPDKNRALLIRLRLLKKYIENHLFLNADRRKDGKFAEQFYFSIAAGISMVFATAVAFSVQQRFENYTMPIFIALVISYMLKDRIKEIVRLFFIKRMSNTYYDNKTRISIKNSPIGWIKESADFISERNVPEEVLKLRSRSDILESDNRNTEEKILLYRKYVNIDGATLDENNQYDISGINDIVRFNFSNFILKMDEPYIKLAVPINSDFEEITGERAYYINFLIQLQYGEQTEYKRIRLTLSRNGIEGIEKFKGGGGSQDSGTGTTAGKEGI